MSVKVLFLALCVAPFAGADALAADCTPSQMLKIRYSNDAPGVSQQTFAAQPKTLYRLGAQYGRIEELPDEPNGIHALIVVSEPDIWIVNLAQKSGRHIVDSGPTYFFRAPLFSDPGSPFLSGMEFGCERAYMRAAGATNPKRVSIAGPALWQYDVTRGREAISLTTEVGSDRPQTVRFSRAGKELLTVHYLEYQQGMTANLELFRRPAGIAFQEAK